MLSWTPISSAIWFTRPETDLSVLETIIIASDNGTVSDVRIDVGSAYIPSQISITKMETTPSSTTISFAAPHLDGLFPILSLTYLQNKIPGEVFAWEKLPVDAEDVILYRKEPITQKSVAVTVTATELGSITTSGTETKIYEFVITSNFTTGRNKLKQEVAGRRQREIKNASSKS